MRVWCSADCLLYRVAQQVRICWLGTWALCVDKIDNINIGLDVARRILGAFWVGGEVTLALIIAVNTEFVVGIVLIWDYLRILIYNAEIKR